MQQVTASDQLLEYAALMAELASMQAELAACYVINKACDQLGKPLRHHGAKFLSMADSAQDIASKLRALKGTQ